MLKLHTEFRAPPQHTKLPLRHFSPKVQSSRGSSPVLANLILCVQYQSLQTTSHSHHNLKTHFLHRTHPRKQKSTLLGPGVSKNTLYTDLCVPASNRAGKTDSQNLERDQSALAQLQHCWLDPALARLSQAEFWKIPRSMPGARDKRVTVMTPRPDPEACLWNDTLRHHHPQLSLPYLHVEWQTGTCAPACLASWLPWSWAPVGSSEDFEYGMVLFFTCLSQDLPLSLPRLEFIRMIALALVEGEITEDKEKEASQRIG